MRAGGAGSAQVPGRAVRLLLGRHAPPTGKQELLPFVMLQKSAASPLICKSALLRTMRAGSMGSSRQRCAICTHA